MRNYYIWTIGCQMNKSESEKLAAYLENQGYLGVETPADADLIILNSCVVRQSAEDRVINKMHALKSLKTKNPGLKIAVTGCIVDPKSDSIKKRFPFIDYFFPAGSFPEWLGSYDQAAMLPRNPEVAAYVPIMQGCNNFCAYCIVPYRRGPEKSRPPEDILFEIRNLVGKGVKEITLLGQNVNSYGRGLPGDPDLADLLTEVNKIEALARIRFLTNHPKDMPPKMIQVMQNLEKVCEQINLPVQAGDDQVLSNMRRGYTSSQYRELINEIRRNIPGIAITTDLIVGFPGESDAQFENSFNLLKEIQFDLVHVAAYSTREGTMASRSMTDDIPAETKKTRLDRVEKLQGVISGNINAGFINRTVEILVEGKQKGKWFGRTRGDKLVFFQSEEDFQSRLVNVKIEHTSPWSLSGQAIF
jgi:tRNA-2-methylthio-N6-dimethylallyladenosine synthase